MMRKYGLFHAFLLFLQAYQRNARVEDVVRTSVMWLIGSSLLSRFHSYACSLGQYQTAPKRTTESTFSSRSLPQLYGLPSLALAW
jgi:hypothetical protein